MSADLSDLMERATRTLPVDTARLVNGGLDRGAVEVRRRRTRATRWGVGLVGATLLVGFLVPRLVSREDTARDVEPALSPGSGAWQLLPADELNQRFLDLLPGPSSPLSVQSSDEVSSVTIQRELTNADGVTGLVQGAFGVFEPMGPDIIAANKESCRMAQTKVGARDGTDCLVVPDGTVMIWDDTVPPEDPGDNAPGVRMAYAYLSRWDGTTATMWAYNTADTGVEPATGTDPVIRTDDLVTLVQQMDFAVSR